MTTDKYTRKTLKIDPDLHKKIKILSAYNGLSMIGLIAKLVDEKMEEIERLKSQPIDGQ